MTNTYNSLRSIGGAINISSSMKVEIYTKALRLFVAPLIPPGY